MRLQGNSESFKNIKHLSALKGRSCVLLCSTSTVIPSTPRCGIVSCRDWCHQTPTVASPCSPGTWSSQGEASELGELLVPELGDFFCKPHCTEEQSLREGLVWGSVLLGQCLGGFELKIPHQRGQRTALKASGYDPGLKQ